MPLPVLFLSLSVCEFEEQLSLTCETSYHGGCRICCECAFFPDESMSSRLCISWMGFFETVTRAVSESPLTELNLAKSFKFVAICKCGFYWPKLLLDARGCLCWYSNVYWIPAVCKTLSQCKRKTTHGSLI